MKIVVILSNSPSSESVKTFTIEALALVTKAKDAKEKNGTQNKKTGA